ncbi:hypothetical protein QJQ45_014526, partial [Haematococcus lacustris]
GRTHAGRLPALHPTQTHHTETTVTVRQTSCSSKQQIKAKGAPHVNKREPAKGPALRHLVMGAALYAVSRLAATLVRGAWQHWRGPQLSPGAPSLVWLRSDLRLQDHEPLRHACLQGGPVLLVYCFDPRDYSKPLLMLQVVLLLLLLPLLLLLLLLLLLPPLQMVVVLLLLLQSCTGFSPTSHQRASFLLDCLADLRHRLRARGADLILRRGQPEQVLPRLLAELGARHVLCHWEAAPEEQQVERAVAQAVAAEGGQLLGFWGASTLHHTLDMPFQLDSMPATYTAFCDAVKGIPVRPPCPAPDSFSLPTSAGRWVYRQLQQQVQQAGTDSWVVMELLWRDYFRLLAMKHHTPRHDDWRQRHTADPGGVPLCV